MALHCLQLRALRLAAPLEDVVLVERTHIVEPHEAGQLVLGGRHLCDGIEGAGTLVSPHLLQLSAGSHEHTQRVGLHIVESHEGAVVVVGHVVDCLHIAHRLHLAHLAVGEICHHLLRRHLVVVVLSVGHHLDGECLSDDMGEAHGGVVHEHLYAFAEQLSAAVPHDGVAVHRHAGVLGVEDEGVADRLHVVAEGAHLAEGMHLAVYGVGIDVEGIDLHRVGMHPEGILLGVVHRHGVLCGEAIARRLVVLQEIAGKGVLALLVDIHHIAASRTHAVLDIVEAVAGDGLALVLQHRPAEELRLVGLGVVISVLGVHHTGTGDDLGGSHHVRLRLVDIVVERIGGDKVLAAAQFHIVDKLRLAGLGMVFAPVGHELALAVDERTALEEVCHTVEAVVVEAVGAQCLLAVVEHHVLSGTHHLHLSVILRPLAVEGKGVALLEVHMSESPHGVGALVEISTVAGEPRPLVEEGHLALEDLCVGVLAIEVVIQLVGMDQVHAVALGAFLVLRLPLALGSLHRLDQTKPKEA